MKATDVLIAEHKYILRALNVIEQMAENVENGKHVDFVDVEHLLRFLQSFADEHHQGKEEAVLFPAMTKAVKPADLGALRQMTFEHNQERSLVEGLEDAVRTQQGKDFAYYARRLVHILRTHIYKEDHILFPLVDRTLPADEDERIAREMQDFDRPWKDNTWDDLKNRLNAMEWKYLCKVA